MSTRINWGEPYAPTYDRPQRTLSPYHRLVMQQQRAQRADIEGRRQAEEFISLAGDALEQSELIAKSFTQGWETLHSRACALREAADGLIDLALRLR